MKDSFVFRCKTPELLAPAGSFNSLRGAVNGGCDGVYMGGKDFSARALADNFAGPDLEEAIDFCHIHNVKAYIAVNTLYFDNEISHVLDFIAFCRKAGADAFIWQDIGAALRAKSLFPDITLHASTQMAAHSLDDVLFLQKQGFSRVVLARETSLEDIKDIRKGTNMELEVFVHGALCCSVSGQCLMSGFIGGRSGNRGNCAQPCRKEYVLGENRPTEGRSGYKGYLLSLRDLMALPQLQDIFPYVDSLKIEGRMKSPEYVAQAVQSYRKAIDSITKKEFANPYKEAEEVRLLAQVFNRGGFTEGYFSHHGGVGMMSPHSPKPMGTPIGQVTDYNPKTGKCKIVASCRLIPGDGIMIETRGSGGGSPYPGGGINAPMETVFEIVIKGNICKGDRVYKSYDKKLMDSLQKEYETINRKSLVTAEFWGREDQAVTLRLKWEPHGVFVEVSGSVPQKARNNPTPADKIREQLLKTGNTAFTLAFKSFLWEEGLFILIRDINELRRKGLDQLSKSITESYKKSHMPYDTSLPPRTPALVSKPGISLFAHTMEQITAGLAAGANRIYIPVFHEILKSPDSSDYPGNIESITEEAQKKAVEIFIALSFPVSEKDDIASYGRLPIDGFLAASYGQIAQIRNTGKKIAMDYRANVLNSLSLNFYENLAYMDSVALSPEISRQGLKVLGGPKSELIAHGRLPLMTTRQCPVGNFGGTKKGDGKYCRLRDNQRTWGQYHLMDERSAAFPLVTNCRDCVAYLYHDRPLFLLDRIQEIASQGGNPPGMYRIMLFNEDFHETFLLVKAYRDAAMGTTESSYKEELRKRIKKGSYITVGFVP